MPSLFDPFTTRGLTLPNRVVVSPMCEYSSTDGYASDWHLVHLGSRATGGAGLVMTEAAAVTAEGRITPEDLGLYQDALQFCDWLETAEWFDSRGPKKTGEWLGVPRRAISQLNSPIDMTLLRRF